jgi:hypothetical protein
MQASNVGTWVIKGSSQLATGSLTAFGQTANYTGTANFAAGESLYFVVSRGNNSNQNDGTGLAATVVGPN